VHITEEKSFKEWLQEELKRLFESSKTEYPIIFWCDPHKKWKDILVQLEDERYEIWTDTENDLRIRHRLFSSDKKPKVIHVPKNKDELGFLQVYADNSIKIIEWDFLDALLRYGAPIHGELQTRIKPHLAGYVKSWLEEPRSIWKTLQTGDDKALITENYVLGVLTSRNFNIVKEDDQFNLFRNTVIEDYGLPDPRDYTEKDWRINSIATMICTEAYNLNKNNPPNTPKYILQDEYKIGKLLDLLENWKRRTDFFPHFENYIREADEIAQIRYWADEIKLDDKVYSSKIVEQSIFDKETEKLGKLEPAQLCETMRKNKHVYKKHLDGFWGKTATHSIPWRLLVEFSDVAEVLAESESVEKQWNTISDATTWYVNKGWEIDSRADNIHREIRDLGALYGTRAKLQRAHQRIMDRTNQVFSELIDQQGLERVDFPYAGKTAEKWIQDKEKTAFLILDAMRYELGKRIVDTINKGEPVERATIIPCKSTIPTITPLGMTYAIPGEKDVEVIYDKSKNNLSIQDKKNGIYLEEKSGREKWLKNKYSLTDSSFLHFNDFMELIDTKSKRLGRKLFVFDQGFDDEGHLGKLKITGSENLVDRYSAAIRKLRVFGYSKICLLTDHGYYHWDPDETETEIKPEGTILLSSRRYIIGYDLQSNESLKLNVTGSNLECLIPRSINIYKTYGGMGFYHGGTTFQEYIIPTIIIEWPEKAKKVEVRLIPFNEITSLNQRVEIEPVKVQGDLFGKVDESVISRRVYVKVEDPADRRVLFKSKEEYVVEPGGSRIVAELENTGEEAGFNSELNLMVCDSENEATLAEMKVVLKVELDTWF